MTEFNEHVKSNLNSFLTSRGFRLSNETKNSLTYTTAKVKITIAHNNRENSNMLWLGLVNDWSIEIDPEIISELFRSDLIINATDKTKFVNNLKSFFEGVGKGFLTNDMALFDKLNSYDNLRGEEFTKKIEREQTLKKAEQAWSKKDYLEFVKAIKELDMESLKKKCKNEVCYRKEVY